MKQVKGKKWIITWADNPYSFPVVGLPAILGDVDNMIVETKYRGDGYYRVNFLHNKKIYHLARVKLELMTDYQRARFMAKYNKERGLL